MEMAQIIEIATIEKHRKKQEATQRVLEGLARNGGVVASGMVYLPPISNEDALYFIVEQAKKDMREALAEYGFPGESIEELAEEFKGWFNESLASYKDLAKKFEDAGLTKEVDSLKYAVQVAISQQP
jgi:hypothetical protein